MRTYRLYLIGEADGVVYSFKDYEAETDASAAAIADSLLPQEVIWGNQRLLKQLSVNATRREIAHRMQ